jgi:hypothetical protein
MRREAPAARTTAQTPPGSCFSAEFMDFSRKKKFNTHVFSKPGFYGFVSAGLTPQNIQKKRSIKTYWALETKRSCQKSP